MERPESIAIKASVVLGLLHHGALWRLYFTNLLPPNKPSALHLLNSPPPNSGGCARLHNFSSGRDATERSLASDSP